MIKRKLFPTSSICKNRGFTIVELLIVIVVISILTTLGIFAYINVRKQSIDSEVVSKANWVSHQLENYRTTHGEYPNMGQLNPVDATTNVTMTDFAPAAAVLGVSTDFLTGPNNVKFHSLCASGCGGIPQKNQYEYVSLSLAMMTAGTPFIWSIPTINCRITIDYTCL